MYSSHGVYHSRARTSSSGEGLGYHTHVTECNKNSEVSKRQVYGGNIYNFTRTRLLLPGYIGGYTRSRAWVCKRVRTGRRARTVGRGPFALGGEAGTLVASGVTRLVILTRRVNILCHTASVVPASGEAVERVGGHAPPGARRAWRVGDDGPLDGASTPGSVAPWTPDLDQGWHGTC